MPYTPPLYPDYNPTPKQISDVPTPEALQMINSEFEAPPPPRPTTPEETADELRPKKGPRRRTLLPSISIKEHTFNPDDIAKKLW